MVNSLLLQGGLEKQSDEDSREYLAELVAIGHCTRTSLAMDFQHLHLAWMHHPSTRIGYHSTWRNAKSHHSTPDPST